MAKKNNSTNFGVLLDTRFMIRLLSESESLHSNALEYFRYFLEQEIPMYFSTVSVAEYCVKGDFEDLPFQNIRILPFNIFHAREAGKYARVLFEARSKGELELENRLIIPNDTKIFAQGFLTQDVRYFVTADVKSQKNISIIQRECDADLEHLDIYNSYTTTFGILPLE